MVFSSTVFLFLFLPIFLTIHFIIQKKYRNIFILFSSLFFYAWGEFYLVFLMICSICVNYLIGLGLSRFEGKQKKTILLLGVLANLLVLVYYKYTGFIIDNLANIGLNIPVNADSIILPIGVSFFTFQNISYLVDVYRKEVPSQKNLVHLGLYISLFPQLIAGPIVRYADIHKEIKNRKIDAAMFESGIQKFIRGLAKKVLIANSLGFIADKTFEISPSDLSSGIAWLGIICYSLQIYFDFSGYSDMAIGLGRMLGFNFKENFNYPYISKSIKEFWRRWHISLSSWFRDYLYIPLGGNRKGKQRMYLNLIIVFLVTGLWHGASWNFVVWGLFHGFFILLERNISFPWAKKFTFLSHFYLLLTVSIGWVFFRSEDLTYAVHYIAKLFSFSKGTDISPIIYLNNYVVFILVIALLFCTPIKTFIKNKISALAINNSTISNSLGRVFYLILFAFTILELSQTTYNPFIYFRF